MTTLADETEPEIREAGKPGAGKCAGIVCVPEIGDEMDEHKDQRRGNCHCSQVETE